VLQDMTFAAGAAWIAICQLFGGRCEEEGPMSGVSGPARPLSLCVRAAAAVIDGSRGGGG